MGLNITTAGAIEDSEIVLTGSPCPVAIAHYSSLATLAITLGLPKV